MRWPEGCEESSTESNRAPAAAAPRCSAIEGRTKDEHTHTHTHTHTLLAACRACLGRLAVWVAAAQCVRVCTARRGTTATRTAGCVRARPCVLVCDVRVVPLSHLPAHTFLLLLVLPLSSSLSPHLRVLQDCGRGQLEAGVVGGGREARGQAQSGLTGTHETVRADRWGADTLHMLLSLSLCVSLCGVRLPRVYLPCVQLSSIHHTTPSSFLLRVPPPTSLLLMSDSSLRADARCCSAAAGTRHTASAGRRANTLSAAAPARRAAAASGQPAPAGLGVRAARHRMSLAAALAASLPYEARAATGGRCCVGSRRRCDCSSASPPAALAAPSSRDFRGRDPWPRTGGWARRARVRQPG